MAADSSTPNTDKLQELVESGALGPIGSESGALGFKKCICKLNWSYPGTAHSIDCPYHEELDIPTPSHQHSYIPIEHELLKFFTPSRNSRTIIKVTTLYCPNCKDTVEL